jgi:hypothetical protein
MDSFRRRPAPSSERTLSLLRSLDLLPGGMTLQKVLKPGGMTLQKLRSGPRAGGGMCLQMPWRHDPAKISLQVAA